LLREADFTGSVNIVNPGEFTMLELAEELIAFAGSRSNLEFKPLPSEAPKQCQSDISVAKQMFARRLNLILEEDLNKTISNSANLG
jgi:UDP-glucuronate decarboxylase